MSSVDRPANPCGKTMGHGYTCVADFKCTQCQYITQIENLLHELRSSGFKWYARALRFTTKPQHKRWEKEDE